MAVVNTLATAVSNADAQPMVVNPAYAQNGPLKRFGGTVEKAAGDSDTSTYRIARLRSGDVLHTMTLFNDALAGATSVKVGLYRTAADGGAAVSDALFATGLSLASASTTGTSILFNNQDIANVNKRLWEALGLSADPQIEYDLVVTLATAGGAAGTISVHGTFCNGN
jgi:hypothetical protein